MEIETAWEWAASVLELPFTPAAGGVAMAESSSVNVWWCALTVLDVYTCITLLWDGGGGALPSALELP